MNYQLIKTLILIFLFISGSVNAQTVNMGSHVERKSLGTNPKNSMHEIGYPQNTTLSPNCWRWERLNPSGLEKAVKILPVAYLVISPLEWHGETLPFGTDPFTGTAIAEMAWERTGGVMIPTLYIGSETEYKDWTSGGLTSYWGMEWITKERNPGSLYVSNYVIELLVRDMLSMIEREGFKVCVLFSWHGATEYSRILKGLEESWEGEPMKVVYSNFVEVQRPEGIDFPGSGGHADYEEVSIMGAVDSTLVDLSLFGKSDRDRKIGLSDKNLDKIDYAKGRAFINYKVEQIVATVNRYLESLQSTK